MLRINLSTIKKCEELAELCRQYKDLIDVDVSYGRYVVDGASVLGVLSLLLHTVDLSLRIKSDEDIRLLKEVFVDRLRDIGAEVTYDRN